MIKKRVPARSFLRIDLHEKLGREIAERNGATDVAKFWNENYNKPLAQAMAELSGHYGLTQSSPHSQNFMVELDQNYRPTGRILIRDLSDFFVNENWFRAIGREDVLKAWYPPFIQKDELHVKVGLFGGNKFPNWMNPDLYQSWLSDFYSEYEKSFADITGIPLKNFRKSKLVPLKNYDLKKN